MKIVDVAEFYAERGGGVRTYIHQKLEAGARRGHEVVIIAPGPEDGEEAKLGGRILWVKGPPLPPDPRYYILWNEARVHALLDHERPDVVEGSSPWSGGWFAARWRGAAKKAFIFHQDPVAVYPQTLLGGLLGPARVDRMFAPYWAYLRNLAGRFDATVVASAWLAGRLRGFGLTNAEAVPFGIDKTMFSPERADAAVKARWLATCGVRADAALWVGISRLHPEKRVFTMLDAFERAARERPMGLVLFGDGPLRGLVARRAARIPGVHLAGFVTDREFVSATLASADGFLHGSAAETYGLVVAEAVCSGLPIVVPDEGGAADLADPSFAETYPAGDARGAAAAMLRSLNRETTATRGAALAFARARVGTVEQHFEGLFAFYEGLVRGR